jgi:hypothetical protein
MSRLRFFSDGVTTVIAESAEDARAAYREHLGGPEYDESESWTETHDDGEPIKVEIEEECAVTEFPEGALIERAGFHTIVTMTPSQWLGCSARGFFSTTER